MKSSQIMSGFFKESSYPNRSIKKISFWSSFSFVVICILLFYLYWQTILIFFLGILEVLKDKNTFRHRINSVGTWAPLIFILFQILQVLVSPIPGELVSAAGGYTLGWMPALIYSTIGLSIGSWTNFFIARLVGKTYVERLIPLQYLSRIAFLMERQGMMASFIFFTIPGFPKDYLCYVLGLAPINWRIFVVISSLGRIPGTFMLSLQGAAVYQEYYWSFLWLGSLSVAIIIPIYIWRERIYHLLYKLGNNND